MENLDMITDVQVSEDERDLTNDELIEQLSRQLDSMIKHADTKLCRAYNQLLKDLAIYQEKWKTASGFMHALETLRSISSNLAYLDEEKEAKDISKTIVVMVNRVIDQINSYETSDDFYENAKDLFEICDVYSKDFIYYEGPYSAGDVALEILSLEFCQQFGPAIDDQVDFRDGSREQIDKLKDKINELNFSTEE